MSTQSNTSYALVHGSGSQSAHTLRKDMGTLQAIQWDCAPIVQSTTLYDWSEKWVQSQSDNASTDMLAVTRNQALRKTKDQIILVSNIGYTFVRLA